MWHQAISWLSVDPVLCLYMETLGHNELLNVSVPFELWSTVLVSWIHITSKNHDSNDESKWFVHINSDDHYSYDELDICKRSFVCFHVNEYQQYFFVIRIRFLISWTHWPQKVIDDKSTLVQVIAGCHEASNHYLDQCWPRSRIPCAYSYIQ